MINRLAKLSLRFSDWSIEGGPPPVDKCVGTAYPHTSNWDGLLLLLLAQQINLDIQWMIKDNHMRGPQGRLLKALGAVAVDRSKPGGLVDSMAEEFERRDRLVLMIPPEGTRGKRDCWKSGFYHIALKAKVPVVPSFLDYRRKRGGFGDPIYLSGDMRADMDKMRSFYASKDSQGKYPSNASPICLSGESGD